MAYIKNKFLLFDQASTFNTALENETINPNSIVFVKDESFIWTQGKKYSCNYDPSELEGDLNTLKGKTITLFNSSVTVGNGGTLTVTLADLGLDKLENVVLQGQVEATYVGFSDVQSTVDATAGATKNLPVNSVAVKGAIDAIGTGTAQGESGKALTSLTQTNGVVTATAGNINAQYVNYEKVNIAGQGEDPQYNTTETTVQGAVTDLYAKLASTGAAGIVGVYKNGSQTNTISADGNDYVIKQGTTTIATLNIAADMVVQSGTVITATGTEKAGTDDSSASAGLTAGKTYVKLIISNANTSQNIIYIDAEKLVKDHTAAPNAEKIQITISNDRVVSADVVAGSIEEEDLDPDLVNELKSGGTVVNPKSTGHVTVTVTNADETTGTPSTVTVTENDIASANFVGTLPSGITATTVTGYITEAKNDLYGTPSDTKTTKTIEGLSKAVADSKTEVTPKSTGHVQVSVSQDATDGHDVVTVSENDIASASYVGTLPSSGTSATTVIGYVDEQVAAANTNNVWEAGTGSHSAKLKNAGSTAAGNNSVSGGDHTSTTKNGEAAFGTYNTSSNGDTSDAKTMFSVGIGESSAATANGLEVRADGSIWLNLSSSYVKLQEILSNEIDWYKA